MITPQKSTLQSQDRGLLLRQDLLDEQRRCSRGEPRAHPHQRLRLRHLWQDLLDEYPREKTRAHPHQRPPLRLRLLRRGNAAFPRAGEGHEDRRGIASLRGKNMSESEIAAATELVIDCAALCRLLRGESDSCSFNSEASETFMAVAMQHLCAGDEPSSSSLALLPVINEHFATGMRTSMQVFENIVSSQNPPTPHHTRPPLSPHGSARGGSRGGEGRPPPCINLPPCVDHALPLSNLLSNTQILMSNTPL